MLSRGSPTKRWMAMRQRSLPRCRSARRSGGGRDGRWMLLTMLCSGQAPAGLSARWEDPRPGCIAFAWHPRGVTTLRPEALDSDGCGCHVQSPRRWVRLLSRYITGQRITSQVSLTPVTVSHHQSPAALVDVSAVVSRFLIAIMSQLCRTALT